MPGLNAPKTQYADGPANTTLITTAETVIATVNAIETTPGGDLVLLEGTAQITMGAAGTSVQLRIRRGTTAAGAQVGPTYQQTAAAGAFASVGMQVSDTPGEVSGQSYVLTAQQVAATGNGTAVGASLQATY